MNWFFSAVIAERWRRLCSQRRRLLGGQPADLQNRGHFIASIRV
jgi:hypothetical protein